MYEPSEIEFPSDRLVLDLRRSIFSMYGLPPENRFSIPKKCPQKKFDEEMSSGAESIEHYPAVALL